MEEMITNLVRTIFGSDYTDLKPIIRKGKNNRVFKIKVKNSSQILRLHPSEKQLELYEKEKWCSNIAREFGVRTPKITHTGFTHGWSYSFQEYIKGTQGVDIEEKELWFKLGQIAKNINQIPANKIAINYTQKIENLFKDNLLVEEGILSLELSDKIRNRLDDATHWRFTPFLCHGNLHPSNIISDSHNQLWVLDWETATGNSAPWSDLSEIYTWNNGKSNIARFCEGYELTSTSVQNNMRKVQTLVLLRLIEVVKNIVVKNVRAQDSDNNYIENTCQRLQMIDDYQSDILFRKNL